LRATAYGNTSNTVTDGSYSELNLRNNTGGNQIYSNDVQITGTGWRLSTRWE
jgi:hypothetical protein